MKSLYHYESEIGCYWNYSQNLIVTSLEFLPCWVLSVWIFFIFTETAFLFVRLILFHFVLYIYILGLTSNFQLWWKMTWVRFSFYLIFFHSYLTCLMNEVTYFLSWDLLGIPQINTNRSHIINNWNDANSLNFLLRISSERKRPFIIFFCLQINSDFYYLFSSNLLL